MLAYLAWHRPAAGVEPDAYEQALERFHRSLSQRPPAGFEGSIAYRAGALPWLAHEGGQGAGSPAGEPGAHGATALGGAYEDWYLLDDWSAVGVLEAAAVSRGHTSAHERIAARAGSASGAVYRLIEGHPRLARTRVAVWVERERGHADPTLAVLLGDGMDPDASSLWQRCLGLGAAPEFCLLAQEPSAGVSSERLPAGWRASPLVREAVWSE